MKIDELREMSYSQLQQVYSSYLETRKLSKNTITTSRNDAFYLLKYDTSIDFWNLLLSNDFEEMAKQHLRETLNRRSSGNVEANLNSYMSHIRRFRKFVFSDDNVPQIEVTVNSRTSKYAGITVPTPCEEEVLHYLELWEQMENYRLQESALNKLFFEYAPNNYEICDILLKAVALNDFYSTNIYSIYPVAKHILSLHIDHRLRSGDVTLVDDIKDVEFDGKVMHFYSFATKYCSHHNPNQYPIYDSYVEDILIYFKNRDSFAAFRTPELKCYRRFKEILLTFQAFYSLDQFSLKQLDQYLWQLGKTYFPKKYK